MKSMLFMLCVFVLATFASENKYGYSAENVKNSAQEIEEKNDIMVRIEEDDYEYTKPSFSKFFGVFYNEKYAKWKAGRWSKNEKKNITNGSYKDEETAAHASDTLARKLIANGEKGHKLNFPDDDTEVRPEVKFSSNFIGVFYSNRYARWNAYRHSKNEKKKVHNGTYRDEETAAHASDILARKLMANGEKGHKLNFPDDDSKVSTEEATYQKQKRKRTDNLENSQESKSHQSSKK